VGARVGCKDRLGLIVGEREVGNREVVGLGDGFRVSDLVTVGTVVGTIDGCSVTGLCVIVAVGITVGMKEGDSSGILEHSARNSPQNAVSEEAQEKVSPSIGQPQVPPAF
jgi:hypothetical protein